MQAQLERGDHAEAASAAAQRPQELGMLVARRAHDAPVVRHQLGGEQVVAGQAVQALQPPRAAPEGEAGHARGRHPPAGGGQAVRLGGAVDIGPERSAADTDDPALGVDDDLVQAADVEHDAVVAQRQAGDRVTARAHRDRQVVVTGEAERGDHVGRVEAAHHGARPAVDHRVEQGAGVLVGRVARHVDAAVQAEGELFEARLRRSGACGDPPPCASARLPR
jgi:hypothetical protein